MFKREYKLSDGRNITVRCPKKREMQNINNKGGVSIDWKNDGNVIIKDLDGFNTELVKYATGLSYEEIDDLYETEFREITKVIRKLMEPSQEEVDFLQQSSQETKEE